MTTPGGRALFPDALREALPRLAPLLEASSALHLALLHRDGTLLWANRALAELLGSGPSDLRDGKLDDFLASFDREPVGACLASAGGAPVERLVNFLVQENQVDTLHCSFLSLGETVVLFAEPTLRNSRSLEKELLQLNNQLAVLARENARKGRELAKTVGALAGEVEARKSAEAELRLYQADLEELVRERTEELGELNRALLRAQHAMDRSRDGVFWASWEGEIAYVNEAAAELAGRPGEECLALAVEDLLPSLTLDRWHGLWQDAQDHGVVELETHFWGREGGDRAVEVSASPVGHGGVEYLVCFVRNLLEPGPPER